MKTLATAIVNSSISDMHVVVEIGTCDKHILASVHYMYTDPRSDEEFDEWVLSCPAVYCPNGVNKTGICCMLRELFEMGEAYLDHRFLIFSVLGDCILEALDQLVAELGLSLD